MESIRSQYISQVGRQTTAHTVYDPPEEILGEGGLLKQLTKAVLERAMQARDGAHIANKAIYLAIRVNLSGINEVLGLNQVDAQPLDD